MTVEIHDTLSQLLNAWGEAIVANDAEAIGKFAHDDWVLVGQTGSVEKRQFQEAVASGALTHDSFHTEVTRVRTYGETAVVTAHVTNTGTFQGQPFTSDEWTSDVFVRAGDGWLCVLTQLTPIASAA